MQHDLRLSWGSVHGSYCLNIEQVGFLFVPNPCISSDSQWMRGSFLLTNSSLPSGFKFTGENENWEEGRERLRHRQESTNRLAMTTFWRIFHHDCKFCPDWWVGGLHALPLSLYLSSRAQLWCTLQLRWQIHSSYFSSTFVSCVGFGPSTWG